GLGTATITATTNDVSFTASSMIEVVTELVPVPVTGVSVDPTATTLVPGGTGQLTATVVPMNADDIGVIWSSSDDRIATVDSNGLVTATGVGTVTITVTSNDGGLIATATILVLDDMIISPNPASEFTQILINLEEPESLLGIFIYDMSGKLVSENNFMGTTNLTGIYEIFVGDLHT
ncbi:unnamed protein product, partial [Ectocarpus sp. 12 AP-2014]